MDTKYKIIKHKLKQIRECLIHQSEKVRDSIKNICDGIEEKIKKNDFSYNFIIDKTDEVYTEVERIKDIFMNFDIKMNVLKDMPTQTVYCIYFNKE